MISSAKNVERPLDDDTCSASSLTETTRVSAEENYVSPQEMKQKVKFWEEIFPFLSKMKFYPYGSSSLIIPDFHPRNIQNILKEASVSDYQYPDAFEGRSDLRASVIENFPEVKLFQDAGHTIEKDNVVITVGVLGGIHVMIDALCQSGDEMIIFEPIYPIHMANILVSKDIKLRTVRMNYTEKTNQFEIDYDQLKRTLNEKTRLIIITNPHNPTTKVFKKEEYLKLTEILDAYPYIRVIEDSSYFLYYQDGEKPTPYALVKPENFDRSITFYSAGKMFNVTGMRVGIAIASKKLMAESTHNLVMTCHLSPAFEQMIVRDNLKSANEPLKGSKDYYEFTRQDINERVARVEKEFTKWGIPLIKFEGTYYLMMNVEKYRNKIDEKYFKDLTTGKIETMDLDKAFCRMMYLERQIGLFPMSCFYLRRNIPDNFVRVPLNRNDKDIQLFLDACIDLLNL